MANEKIKRELRVLHAYPIKLDYVSGTNLIPIRFYLKDITIPYNATAKIFVKKPSGNVVFNDCTIDLGENAIEITPTAQMFAEPGDNLAQLQILDNGELINSYPITFNVYPMLPEDEAVTSKDEFGTFESLLNSAMSITYGAVQQYIEDHGLTQGATPAQAAQIQQNTSDISALREELDDIGSTEHDLIEDNLRVMRELQSTVDTFATDLEDHMEEYNALLSRVEAIEDALRSRNMNNAS